MMGCVGFGVLHLFQVVEAMALYYASLLSFCRSYGILVLNLRLFFYAYFRW